MESEKLENIQMEKILLNDSLFIGEGGSRKCYIHPYEKDLCIKVTKKESDKRSVKREVDYFKRLQKRGKSFDMISKYFHKVQTDQGEGEIYELVRDYNGEISKDLKYYLNLKDESITQQVIKRVEDLRVYLRDENIRFSDLCSHNILLKKINEKEYTLIIIDGVGDNNQVPLLEYFPFLGIKRSIRKWEKFRLELIEEFGCNKEDIKQFIEK